MADKIVVKYAEVQDLANHFKRVGAEVYKVGTSARRIAQELKDGVLVGKPGNTCILALVELEKRANLLHELFAEVVRDIESATNDIARADGAAGKEFA